MGRIFETRFGPEKLVCQPGGGGSSSSSSGSIVGGIAGARSGGVLTTPSGGSTITTVSGATAGGSGAVEAGWAGAATCPILIGIVNCVSLLRRYCGHRRTGPERWMCSQLRSGTLSVQPAEPNWVGSACGVRPKGGRASWTRSYHGGCWACGAARQPLGHRELASSYALPDEWRCPR